MLLKHSVFKTQFVASHLGRMRRSFEQACTLSTHPTHHTHVILQLHLPRRRQQSLHCALKLTHRTSTQNFHIVNGIQNSHGIVTASSFNYFLSHTVNILRDFLGVEIARGGARRHVVDPSPGGASSLFALRTLLVVAVSVCLIHNVDSFSFTVHGLSIASTSLFVVLNS